MSVNGIVLAGVIDGVADPIDEGNLYMRTGMHLFSIVFVAFGWSACSGESNPADPADRDVIDKADDGSCPAEVGINSAAGLQRRCYDLNSGRFVPTICCEADGLPDDKFGNQVDNHRHFIIVSAPQDNNEFGDNAGAVFAY